MKKSLKKRLSLNKETLSRLEHVSAGVITMVAPCTTSPTHEITCGYNCTNPFTCGMTCVTVVNC
jgi:hypothetical protein